MFLSFFPDEVADLTRENSNFENLVASLKQKMKENEVSAGFLKFICYNSASYEENVNTFFFPATRLIRRDRY